MSNFTTSPLSDYLYDLEAFLDSGLGTITIGRTKLRRCAILGALVRRDGETTADLLARLDCRP